MSEIKKFRCDGKIGDELCDETIEILDGLMTFPFNGWGVELQADGRLEHFCPVCWLNRQGS